MFWLNLISIVVLGLSVLVLAVLIIYIRAAIRLIHILAADAVALKQLVSLAARELINHGALVVAQQASDAEKAKMN